MVDFDAESGFVAKDGLSVLERDVDRGDSIFGFCVAHFDGDVIGNHGCEVRVVVSGRTAEGHWQVEAVRGISDLESAGDSGHSGADLNYVGGAVVEVREEVAERVKVFASADRSFDRVADASETEKIPPTGRFFDPHEIEPFFHFADFADGLLRRPIFVGIDHQTGFVGVDA